jgi:hypothetical protein
MFSMRKVRVLVASGFFAAAGSFHVMALCATLKADEYRNKAGASKGTILDRQQERVRVERIQRVEQGRRSLDQGAVGFAVLGVVVALSGLKDHGVSQRKRLPREPLDTVLFTFTPNDPFSARDLCNGGVVILGRPGSGKTSSSGKILMRAIIGYPGSGLLIITGKPEEKADVIRIFEEAGRRDDLIIVEPESKWRLNFFDYLSSRGADAAAIADCIMIIGESLQAGEACGGGDESHFFRQQHRLWIFNAVTVLKVARGKVSAPDLHKFINTAASSTAQLFDEEWQKNSFHNHCLKAAFAHVKGINGIEADDCRLALDGWVSEWAGMADRTRTSILAGLNGILHTGTTGLVRSLSAGETNCWPEMMFEGKTILLNVPISKYGPSGAFLGAAWRFLTQQAVLRRETKPGDSIHVIWMDEFQTTINSFDYQYLAQSRSRLGAMVCLTQSVPGLIAALKGHTARSQAEALLAAFGHRIFHACDPVTAEYGASCIGKALTTFVGGSMGHEEDMWSTLGMGGSRFNGSFSEHMESILQPRAFMSGLRTGGQINSYFCDAIVVRSGEAFASNGQNFVQVAFSQR